MHAAEDGFMKAAAKKWGVVEGVDFWSIVHFVRDQLWVIAGCVALGASAALAYGYLKAPTFVSEAIIEVSPDDAVLEFGQRENTDLNSASLLKTIEQTVASQAVLRRVLEKQHLADDPTFAPPRKNNPYSEAELLDLLEKRLDVNLIRGTRLISLIAVDRDPVKAQRLAQGVIDEFLGQQLTTSQEGTGAAREYLTAEAMRVKNELTLSEERLQLYREKYNAVSLTDSNNLVADRLAHLSEQVTQARALRFSLETDKLQVEALSAQGPEALLNLRGIAALPDVIDLRKQLNQLNSDRAALSQRYREKHPRMVEITKEAEETRANLDATLQRSAEAVVQAYRAAKANEDILQHEYDTQEKLTMELSRIAIPYRALERDVESNQVVYQQVLGRLKEAGVNQALLTVGNVNGSRIHITQQPLVPVQPSGMSKKILMMMGIFAGGALGACLAAGRRALDNSLPSVDEAESYLGLPSLAVIHRSKLGAARSDLLVNTHPASLEAESFRSLRTALCLLTPQEGGRVVMFTSAVPGEGKSFCSLNYAASVAQQDLKTLLIDGDLRRGWLRPALAPGSSRPGLSDCLRDKSLLGEAVHETATKNLFVLGNRRGSSQGVELLAGDSLPKLIEWGLLKFDRIVIDTAPVTAVSDALYFARHVSMICLVVNARATSRRTVRRACTMLENTTGAPPAGIVLNQIRRGRAGAYYYYANSESYEAGKSAPAAARSGFLKAFRKAWASSETTQRP